MANRLIDLGFAVGIFDPSPSRDFPLIGLRISPAGAEYVRARNAEERESIPCFNASTGTVETGGAR
jgi:hypothetical protein